MLLKCVYDRRRCRQFSEGRQYLCEPHRKVLKTMATVVPDATDIPGIVADLNELGRNRSSEVWLELTTHFMRRWRGRQGRWSHR